MTTGETVPATEAGRAGSIYDLGYRSYEGPRLGRAHAFRALFGHTLRTTYGLGRGGRAKIAPMVLAALALIPAVVMVGAIALLSQAFGDVGDITDVSPIDHGSYYGIITTLVVLFCAAQAPETLGRDQRHRLLTLLFSRALRRTDYALARFAGLAVAILIFVLLPQAVIFLGLTLLAPDVGEGIGGELPAVLPIVAQGLLMAGVLGGLSAAIASFTGRRAYATTAIIALFLIAPLAAALIAEVGPPALGAPASLLSPPDVLDATNAWLFEGRPESIAVRRADLPPPWYGVAALVMAVASVAVLVRRAATVPA